MYIYSYPFVLFLLFLCLVMILISVGRDGTHPLHGRRETTTGASNGDDQLILSPCTLLPFLLWTHHWFIYFGFPLFRFPHFYGFQKSNASPPATWTLIIQPSFRDALFNQGGQSKLDGKYLFRLEWLKGRFPAGIQTAGTEPTFCAYPLCWGRPLLHVDEDSCGQRILRSLMNVVRLFYGKAISRKRSVRTPKWVNSQQRSVQKSETSSKTRLSLSPLLSFHFECYKASVVNQDMRRHCCAVWPDTAAATTTGCVSVVARAQSTNPFCLLP